MREFIEVLLFMAIYMAIYTAIDIIRSEILIGRNDTNIRIIERRIRTRKARMADLDFEIETSDIPDEFKN